MAKKTDINLDLKEISTKLADSRKELLNLRFKKTSGQLENFSQIKKNKKDIARLLTKKKQLIIKGQSNA